MSKHGGHRHQPQPRAEQRAVQEPQPESAKEPVAGTLVVEVTATAAPAESIDAHGNVECEALQGIMHLGQFVPSGSRFSLERQLFRRLKKLGCVTSRRQD